MKKRIVIIAAFLVVLLQTIYGQDIIELYNGKKINVKILQQTSQELKCILWNKPDSDTITVNESEILMMRHIGIHEEILLNISNLYNPSNDSIPQRKTNRGLSHYGASNPTKSHISFGYGFYIIPDAFEIGGNSSNKNLSSPSGPLFLKYEYAISDYIGFGINFAYCQYTFNNNYEFAGISNNGIYYTTQYTSYSILGHLNFHFLSRFVSTRFDPYYGLGIGYKSVSTSVTSNDSTFQKYNNNISNEGSIGFEMTFGLRYYVSNSIALYGEAGLAKSWLQFGATLKF
jgi:opacity protein-like surface antigen